MKKIGVMLLALAVSGCAVAEASKTRGVRAEEATHCESRTCFLTLRDIQVMTSAPGPEGSLVETYKVLLKHGSAGRAVLHGLLDIGTFGAWELAGTPIEGSADKNKYIIVTAQFDRDGRVVATAVGDRIPNLVGAPQKNADVKPIETAASDTKPVQSASADTKPIQTAK